MFAIYKGTAHTHTLNVANEDCIKVATVLNNAFYLEDLHFTVEGRDTHYFVKPGLPDGDLATLRLTSGHKTLENGVNVSVSQSPRSWTAGLGASQMWSCGVGRLRCMCAMAPRWTRRSPACLSWPARGR